MLKKLSVLLMLVLCSTFSWAQEFYVLRGYVYSESNEPLSLVQVRVQDLNLGAVTDNKGRYELRLPDGLHRITYTHVGYEPQTFDLVIHGDQVQNVFLLENSDELETVSIRRKKRDLSYEIIRNVIENREKYRTQYETMHCEAYIKSFENREPIKQVKKPDEEEKEDVLETGLKDTMKNKSLFECQLSLDSKPPFGTKEKRNAVKKYGDQSNLFYTSTTDGTFDLYKNLLMVPKLGSNGMVSPISPGAFATYKFKLLGSYYDSSFRKVYKVKVIPRKMGNANYSGTLEVYDSLWVLKSADLNVPKHVLTLYDGFRFKLEFEEMDTNWVLSRQHFYWEVKEEGQDKKGETHVQFSGYVFDTIFPKRYFNAQVGITTKEAYERDTGYWAKIRPMPLTIEEMRFMAYKDSLNRVMNSEEYLDSIDSIYNKITLLKLAWTGFGRINRSEKTLWEFDPAIGFLDPLAIGGWRIRYNFSYTKRYENRKRLVVSPLLNYGFRNQDVRGNLSVNFLYDPKHLGIVSFDGGRYFGFVNGFATINDIARRDNFFENQYVSLRHRRELVNGLYSYVGVGLTDRSDLSDFEFAEVGDSLFPDNDPIFFNPSRVATTTFGFSFTPYQLFLDEPLEKIVLGSRFPTFDLFIRKAWSGIFNADVNYLYTEFSIEQAFNIGVIGTSQYRFTTGKFLNRKRLEVMDYRYQRGGDPFLFTPAMYTFQLIDSTFATFDWFFEAHYVHQFNGFITSRLPFMKKLGIKSMGGAGFLVSPEYNFQYSELYYGINRIFKIGRERLRLGVYYVVSQSNTQGFRSGLKVSFEPYNRDKNTWTF
jgi:hypothetical protein